MCVREGYRAIALEDLNVKGMMSNSRLAPHIADAGIGGLLQKIRYKAGETGLKIIEIPRFYASSKTCPDCGEKNEIGSRERWTCSSCGVRHDRDQAAARNIKDAAWGMLLVVEAPSSSEEAQKNLDELGAKDVERLVRERKRLGGSQAH